MIFTKTMSRRAALGTSAAVAALVLSACSGAENTEQNSASPQSATTSSAHESAQETRVRDESGYHLNELVKEAPTVTLYTDYQCPYCQKVEPAFEEAAGKLNGELNVTVKHFPLPMHQYAVHSSVAVQAAEKQGKHLAMAHKIFENQQEWKSAADTVAVFHDYFAVYAEELGLDTEQFKQDYESEDALQVVKDNYDAGQEAGVSGTPTFVVEGKPLENVDSSTSADDMVKAFKEAAGL